jgi:hypothetical protein
MIRGINRLVVGAAAVVTLAATSLIGSTGPSIGNPTVANRILARQLEIELGQQARPHWLQPVSSGPMYTLLQATGVLNARAAHGSGALVGQSLSSTQGTQGCHKVFVGKTTDVRVNQDCSMRRQAEEAIAVNPTNPKNLIAGQNDSRVGFNHCGVDWSLDGGATWGDQLPPFYQYVQLDGHTADACSDPTETFDSQGNAYTGGVIFDISSAANSVVVMKSNAHLHGTFYHNPGPGAFQEFSTDTPGVIASDNDPNVFNDKELMTADWHKGSPKHDNVYMTWTRFRATQQGVGADSPIFFSQSTDGGATWSPGIEISGSGNFCTVGSGEKDPNACDQDQGSDPVVGWDGTISVSFNNTNAEGRGMAQQLVVSCPSSANCSQSSSWKGPYKIADDFATQPIGPDSSTGCSSGRQCLPPNGYRLNDFGAISVAQNGHLFFTWSDYRHGMKSKNCPGLSNAANDKPPCNNDAFYSFSVDGGKTWSITTLVTPATPFGKTAQWQAWGAVSQDSSTYYVAFYDRSHGKCEFTGCNDITLATINHPDSGNPTFKYRRLTVASMPNLTPSNNPIQAGFLGDYMWVATMGNGAPHVVWASTAGLHNTAEEDIYFAR